MRKQFPLNWWNFIFQISQSNCITYQKIENLDEELMEKKNKEDFVNVWDLEISSF